MNDFIKRHWIIIKKHLRNVLIFFISINLMAILSFGIVFNNHTNYMATQLDNNIIEYNEVDREQLCKIADCIEVASINLNKTWRPNKKGQLIRELEHKHEFYGLNEILYVSDWAKVAVYNKKSDTFFILNTEEIVGDYIFLMDIFMPLSLLLFILPLIKSISEEQEESMIKLAGSEALLANKSMINITENIHHELNTPLEVIDNKIEKIRRALKSYLIEEGYNTCNISDELKEKSSDIIRLEEDFDFIKSSSEQIYTVLEKMKGFKHLRYSNGNKSIKNIIDGGFKIINISNTNFVYKVDKKLLKYNINSTALKNADLLSITLNHIKNSLEANASKIYIIMVSHEEGILKLRIIDNGNGIPKKAQANIFKANFSTKSEDSGIRGNGMYLNKHILKTSGGDIKLISSSNKGTTIELSIPAKEK